MTCLPPPEIPEGHYSRLCPGEWPPHDEEKLKRLADMMQDNEDKRAARKRTLTMPSGYVYLGQFIDHDLTRDNRYLKDAIPDAEQTINYRTPRLDLDHLYGRASSEFPDLYEEDGRLCLGQTMAVPLAGGRSLPGSFDDLKRGTDGSPKVIDPRSDENLVIAQIHVLFAKFHNRLLSLLPANPHLSAGPVGTSLCMQARRLVTWHYQWIIINDFLPRFVRAAALQEVHDEGLRLFPRVYAPFDYPMALPIEFTVAAFRFGHSMIQEDYLLSSETDFKTALELIRMTHRGGNINTRSPALPANYVIDWDHFFNAPDAQLNRGQNIDTFITDALYQLPQQTVELFRLQLAVHSLARSQTNEPMRLPEMTLCRGSKMRLPSGEEFARSFGYKPLDSTLIPVLPADKAFFEQPEFRGRTPLWYYLLREAAVEEITQPEPQLEPDLLVQKLGTIGSRIVAEVFYQLLASDCDSIMHAGCGWRPPRMVFGRSREPRPVDSMPAMIEFAQTSETQL
jgi:hypothetical protein